MNKEDLRIVFFGTPEFAVESLKALVEGSYNVVGVVTMPDKPAGRGKKLKMSDVKAYALHHDLPVLQPERLRDENFLEELRDLKADLFIVIAFRMLPEVVWDMPKFGTFNLHASLLPKYRGAAPINHAIMNGESKTGVTTFFLTHEIDTGDIITQREVAIGEDETVGELYDRLMKIGAEEVIATVNAILENNVKVTPQPEGEFTPAPKIFKNTCEINWNRPAEEVHNFIRGLSPYPAAWCSMLENTGRPLDVKILRSSIKNLPYGLKLNVGEARVDGKHLYVGTLTSPLEILEIQPSGKRVMEASAFVLGYHPMVFKSIAPAE